MHPLSEQDISLIRSFRKNVEDRTIDKSLFLDSVGRVVGDNTETIIPLDNKRLEAESDVEDDELDEGEQEQEQE